MKMKNKTINEWFNTVGDVILREKLIERCQPSRRGARCKSLRKALSTGFVWRVTPEGYDYWYKLCKMYKTYNQ